MFPLVYLKAQGCLWFLELMFRVRAFVCPVGSTLVKSTPPGEENTPINLDVLKDGFKIVGDFLNKSVLIPNNINYPVSRNEFLKLI